MKTFYKKKKKVGFLKPPKINFVNAHFLLGAGSKM